MRSYKRFMLACLVTGSLATVTSAAAPADAAYSACRSDPVVTLSNGAHVTLYEDIYADPTSVAKISYTLHIPVGLKVTGIAYNGAIPAKLQSLSWKADDNSGDYDAYTVVTATSSSWSVTAYMSGTGNGSSVTSAHTSGQTGQLLHSHLHFY